MNDAPSTHRVVIEFDDGVSAKLICPDDGTCAPAAARGVLAAQECWVKTWFDNCTADELLTGKVEVPVTAEWDTDHPVVTIDGGEVERLREREREAQARVIAGKGSHQDTALVAIKLGEDLLEGRAEVEQLRAGYEDALNALRHVAGYADVKAADRTVNALGRYARDGMPSRRAEFEARAREYFGTGNTEQMAAVHLAEDVVALVEGERLWLYTEPFGNRHQVRGLTVRLTAKRRRELLATLVVDSTGGDDRG